ncbi:hypothetical protein ACFFGH_17150 [Lysobacter korlensis]|uniref:Uncharacterized protein n=1 Tax=Lysobacter korlensis TaxID=553636 RepID=A0ABV6RRH0_9GAMM
MTREQQPDTTSSSPDRDRKRELAPEQTPTDGNPNERLEQWEDRYFEKSADEGRGDPGPNH